MTDKTFVPGVIVKRGDNAPDFILANVSVKKRELIEWLESTPGDWVNWVLKRGRSGKCYAEVDTWKPERRGADMASGLNDAVSDPNDSIPF